MKSNNKHDFNSGNIVHIMASWFSLLCQYFSELIIILYLGLNHLQKNKKNNVFFTLVHYFLDVLGKINFCTSVKCLSHSSSHFSVALNKHCNFIVIKTWNLYSPF